MTFARLAVSIVSAAVLCTPPAQAAPGAPDRVVSRWIAVTLDEIAAQRVDPPHSSRVLASLSVAAIEECLPVRMVLAKPASLGLSECWSFPFAVTVILWGSTNAFGL